MQLQQRKMSYSKEGTIVTCWYVRSELVGYSEFIASTQAEVEPDWRSDGLLSTGELLSLFFSTSASFTFL
jgi:hypothetical protein